MVGDHISIFSSFTAQQRNEPSADYISRVIRLLHMIDLPWDKTMTLLMAKTNSDTWVHLSTCQNIWDIFAQEENIKLNDQEKMKRKQNREAATRRLELSQKTQERSNSLAHQVAKKETVNNISFNPWWFHGKKFV